MTDSKCPRCDEWFDRYEDHDTQHLEERRVEALERIADRIEKATDAFIEKYGDALKELA
jgi:uncharacterized C2H2 Zn-finger protein